MANNTVVAEVTGTVWKIEAKIGEKIALDDVIMIVESMKMEIPVHATEAGELTELLTAEGEIVNEGQAVAVISS